MAELRLRLFQGRQGRAGQRIGGKVRPAVVVDLDSCDLRVVIRPERIDGQCIGEIQARSAPEHRPIVELVRKSKPGLHVVRVIRAIGSVERLNGNLVRPRIEAEVVAHAEIQRQPRRHAPVVLDPRCVLGLAVRIREPPDADGVGAGDWRQRSEVPRVGVPWIGEQRFDVGGNRAVVGQNGAAALRAVLTVLVMADEFAARLQIVMAPQFVRRREVVADLPDPLIPVPGSVRVRIDGEAGEGDARIAVGHPRRLPVLRPGHEGLVGKTVVTVSAPDLVHCPIAQHLCELPEIFLVAFIGIDRRRRMTRRRAVAKRLVAALARDLAHRAHTR